MQNFEEYLKESLLDTQVDAKKYRCVADHFKTSVGLVSSKGQNLFVAQTVFGDKLCACLSMSDESEIYQSHIGQLLQEAYDCLNTCQFSYESKEDFLVNVLEAIDPADEGKRGIWQAYFFYPEGTDRKYKTEFGNKGTSPCAIKSQAGQFMLVKTTKVNFTSDSVLEAIKREIERSITHLDSVQYALKKVYPEWQLESSFDYNEYKIYVPKHA